jgi:hypothetical protein
MNHCLITTAYLSALMSPAKLHTHVIVLLTENDLSKLPIALENMTQNQSQINTIALHLDNDYAGRNAASAIATQLEEKYVIRDEPPAYGKDCNDYLQHMIRQKPSRQMGRE